MTAARSFSRALASLARERTDPARCARVLSGRIVAPADGRSPAGLVLGSGVLLYRWVDLSSVPRNRRRAAAAAQLRAWTPFADSGYRIAWFEDSAGLFAWDAARLRQRLGEAGLMRSKPLPVLPEAWLTAPPASDAARLVQRSEGVEAQVWQRGSLRASRWWPQAPSEEEWLNFQRGAGLGPGAMVPLGRASNDESTTASEGWAPLLSEADLQGGGGVLETLVAIAASLALMAWTAALAHEHWQLGSQLQQARERVVLLEKTSQPVIASREAALREAQQATALTEMLQAPDALAVLEHVLLRLARLQGLLVRQFELNGKQLRLALEVPAAIERASVVTALEEGGWLTDVREARESGGSTLTLTMVLNAGRPPATALSLGAAPPAAASAQGTAPAPGMLPGAPVVPGGPPAGATPAPTPGALPPPAPALPAASPKK